MPTPLTDADKVLRNDTGIDIATNIASIASALTPSNITDLGDVNLTNPITDGQVIKYDTATQKWVNGLGNITMECTQAQYDAWKQSGQLKTNTLYVITDAPNLNATAQDISYDGGADTVWDKVEKCLKSDELTVFDSTYNSNANGTVDSNQMVSGGIPYASYDIISIWSEDGYLPIISKYSSRYTFDIHSNSDFSLVRSATVKLRLIVAKNLTQ